MHLAKMSCHLQPTPPKLPLSTKVLALDGAARGTPRPTPTTTAAEPQLAASSLTARERPRAANANATSLRVAALRKAFRWRHAEKSKQPPETSTIKSHSEQLWTSIVVKALKLCGWLPPPTSERSDTPCSCLTAACSCCSRCVVHDSVHTQDEKDQ